MVLCHGIDRMPELHTLLADNDHQELHFIRDEAAGLRAYIAIHDTTLGPAAGGTRRYAFESEASAIEDVLELSRAMTYKYALAGIDMGGAKGVIWIEEDQEPTEALYRAYGRAVEALGGRFVTGGDVGTDTRELRWINRETEYVVGMPEQFDHPDGYHGGGLGVVTAMEACCELVYDDPGLAGRPITIQGLGDMGWSILRYLSERDADVIVTDVDQARLDAATKAFDVTVIDPDAVFDVDADIFCPAALGGILNDDTIPRLDVDIVCGAANNQLADETRHAEQLHERGILYAPDYLANAGRTIDDTDVFRPGGYDHERARAMIGEINPRMQRIGHRSHREDIPPLAVANSLAEERLEAIGGLRAPVRESRVPDW